MKSIIISLPSNYLEIISRGILKFKGNAKHNHILTLNHLCNTTISIPSLPEQRCVAEIPSKVDKKLELERVRKKKLERIKKGLMNELLTGMKRIKIE